MRASCRRCTRSSTIPTIRSRSCRRGRSGWRGSRARRCWRRSDLTAPASRAAVARAAGGAPGDAPRGRRGDDRDPGDADRAALRPGAEPDLRARSRGRVRRARRRARPARRSAMVRATGAERRRWSWSARLDSYLDLGLLYALDAEGRLKTGEVADGFVPGEGAAFLLLGPRGQRRAQRPAADRAHHRRGSRARGGPPLQRRAEPRRRAGGGVRRAVRARRRRGEPRGRAASTPGSTARASGPRSGASPRSAARGTCASGCASQHPADCFGDAGAALGLIMLGLGALDLSRGRIDGDCLVWGGADRGERGAALLAR